MTVEITRTAKIKIELDIDLALRTISEWNRACNYISQVCFDNPSAAHNKVKIQELVYEDVRNKFNLSSQVTISAIRQVTAKYQSAKCGKSKIFCHEMAAAMPKATRGDC